jgi:mxaK protein
MRRVHGHIAFGLVATALATLIAVECARLQHAQRVNMSVAAWTLTTTPTLTATTMPMPTVTTATMPTVPATKTPTVPAATTPTRASPPRATPLPDNPLPEARLAQAVALSKVDYDGALAAYKSIIQSDREDLRRIGLYDLGNLHLRQAIQDGLADEAQSLPLIELAKQSYRELLRRDPNDWDARYNLERALRLAPEDDPDADEDSGPPDPKEHERSTIADPRMDLP